MASLRTGFFVGFLGGALASSALSREGDEPELTGATEGDALLDQAEEPRGLLQKLRARVREAVAAGREAAREKEEELRREFEQDTRPRE
jgi:hypothetical protein